MMDDRGTMNESRKAPSKSRIEQGAVQSLHPLRSSPFIILRSAFIVSFALCLCVSVAKPARAQLETVDSATPASLNWVNQGQSEGHLALKYSPAGAFSPDGSTLAVISDDKIMLMDLRAGGIRKILRVRIEGIIDLSLQSAGFLTPTRLFLIGNGFFRPKGKEPAPPTPTLAFEWDPEKDSLLGKVNSIGARGGYAPAIYFPMIGYLSNYKESRFVLWHPLTGKTGQVAVPSLTRQPNLYGLSPDGHWLILAQLEGSGSADPTVVNIRDGKFTDSLRGHQGTTLSIAFSRDNQRVVTTCEDGKVRVYSVGDWKLLHTLTGHSGPVHWAEFSPDGQWVVSGGEDKTVRIWSAVDGSLAQILSEAHEPIRTVASSPNGEFIAASSEKMVWVWKVEKR